MTEAIPFCLMRGFEDCIAETQIPETRVFDADLTINNYAQYRILKGKSKRSACQKCVYFSVCEGPWKEYPQLFGWEEFTPVLKTYKTQKNNT
jgi:hypothetical protein